MHFVRDQIVDLVVGQVPFFFPGIDQFFNIVILVVKSQSGNTSRGARSEKLVFPNIDSAGFIRNFVGGNLRILAYNCSARNPRFCFQTCFLAELVRRNQFRWFLQVFGFGFGE